MSKYRIEEINVGDEIYYEDKYRSNRHLHWKVLKKIDESMLLIEGNEAGFNEQRLIDILDVRKLVLLPKK
jgi:hypothetical protein